MISQNSHKVVLIELHREHMRMSCMKALAHAWWKGLDMDLEELGRSCHACLSVKQSPAKAPLHPWTISEHPCQ